MTPGLSSLQVEICNLDRTKSSFLATSLYNKVIFTVKIELQGLVAPTSIYSSCTLGTYRGRFFASFALIKGNGVIPGVRSFPGYTEEILVCVPDSHNLQMHTHTHHTHITLTHAHTHSQTQQTHTHTQTLTQTHTHTHTHTESCTCMCLLWGCISFFLFFTD